MSDDKSKMSEKARKWIAEMPNYSPKQDFLVIRSTAAEMTEGGLHIPETARDAMQNKVYVLAVGPGIWKDGQLHVPDVKPGDRIIFQGEVREVEHRGTSYAFIRYFTQVIATMPDDEDGESLVQRPELLS